MSDKLSASFVLIEMPLFAALPRVRTVFRQENYLQIAERLGWTTMDLPALQIFGGPSTSSHGSSPPSFEVQ